VIGLMGLPSRSTRAIVLLRLTLPAIRGDYSATQRVTIYRRRKCKINNNNNNNNNFLFNNLGMKMN